MVLYSHVADTFNEMKRWKCSERSVLDGSITRSDLVDAGLVTPNYDQFDALVLGLPCSFTDKTVEYTPTTHYNIVEYQP